MYHLLFRSRWFALAWVLGMAAYAVFMTSGGSILMSAPSAASESAANAKREAEEEKKAKFAEWAQDEKHAAPAAADQTSDNDYAPEAGTDQQQAGE